MRKTFTPLDDVLIERLFQPAADMIARWTSVSQGGTVCFCLDLASLSWIVSRARGLSDAMVARNAGASLLDLSLLLLGLVAFISLRTLFRRARGKQGNPLRLAMRPHRAIVLLMLVTQLLQLRTLDVGDAAGTAMLVFTISALYLGACIERPPVQRILPALATVR